MHSRTTNNSLLHLPGHWIDAGDRDWAFTIAYLLGYVVNQYNEALVACELFNQSPALETVITKQSFTGEIDDRIRILVFMHAKSFIYALDYIRAFLSILANQSRLPVNAIDAIQDFRSVFGHVRQIRNSLQHIEERAQGIGFSRREIQSVILDLGSFNERHFGITSGDGHHVEIEVSQSTLSIIRSLLEQVIWSFAWLGPREILVEPE